ncbi:MAG TPA: histidine kinase dimerization/phospho-acceptor domain-containing protein, partial [Clostridia bacterium]|nr:histidine kinase dimerization/phospho-acceptor domain-containing protein [Clostridia bacterium]
MTFADSKRRPRFFWQGALIVLPVVVLSAVGFFSLRQDKILARHEAEDRAQMIAEGLVPRIWSALTESAGAGSSQHQVLEIDAAGHLVFPPPYASAPADSPWNPVELRGDQGQLWQSAQKTEVNEKDPAAAIRAYQQFLDSKPPTNFAGAAHYALGLLHLKNGQAQEAVGRFEKVLEECPAATGESGLPLAPLAQVKLLELSSRKTAPVSLKRPLFLDLVCSNAVHHPTPWSPYLWGVLSEHTFSPQDQETLRKWQRTWQEHEALRELFSALSSQLQPEAQTAARLLSNVGQTTLQAGSAPESGLPRLVWFQMPAGWQFPRDTSGTNSMNNGAQLQPAVEEDASHWLAIRIDSQGTNQWIVCRSEYAVGAAVTSLANTARDIPDYFGLAVEMGGRKLNWPAPDLRVWRYADYSSRSGSTQRKQFTGELASTVLGSSLKSEDNDELLKVNVYLTSPTTLYRHQQRRKLWFGLLIAASSAAAIVGLFAAYRAFRRQLRLSEMKSNFVSSVSHELRAPIASVRLMAESLESGKVAETPKQQEYFRFIVQECRRLSSLIENVLDFSRIDQGRKQYEFEPTDVVALSQQTVKLMEPYAAEKEVRLALQIPETQLDALSSQITMDGKAIQQALINLIDNAIKHSPKGETVTLGVEVQKDGCRTPGEAGSERESAGTEADAPATQTG